jgi:hypothetical protein
MVRALGWLVCVVGLVVATACAPAFSPPGGLAGGAAAPAGVERFLHFAAQGDYVGMGWVFGTTAGPVAQRDPLPQVEQRMYALANLLGHDSFVLGSGAPVPGRAQEAMRFNVVLQRGTRSVPVPFVAVRGPGGRWYVEQVDVQAVTGP